MSSSELLTWGLREGEGTQLMNSKCAFSFWSWGVCWKNRKGDRAGEWRWCFIVVVFKESCLRGHQGKSVLGMEPGLFEESMWGKLRQRAEVKAYLWPLTSDHWPEASWAVMLRPLAPQVWLNDRHCVILSFRPEREGMLLAYGVWGTECCWSSRAHSRECPDLRGVRVETACFVITELISCWLIEFVFEGIMRRNSKMSWARLFFWVPGQHTLAIHTEAIAGLLTVRMGSLNLICSQFKQMWCTICKEALATAWRMVVIQPWEGLHMLRRPGTAPHCPLLL